VATKFEVEARWPELFAQLDGTQRRAVVQSLASAWHEGWEPNREDVENLTDEARGAIDGEEYMRRVRQAAERRRKAVAVGRRVFFRDVKLYEVPESLDDLRGPAGGVVELSHSVLWAPGGGGVDLDEPGGTAMAYQGVLAEGTVEDQVSILNRDRLIAVWPDLMLPLRVRQMWEGQFPELHRAAVA
jgi:hypothetical protein